MNAWWSVSVCINRTLGGRQSEPLCSRVYRQPPSRWRSMFMLTMDRLFREVAHCENIHLRWRDLHHDLQGVWAGSGAGSAQGIVQSVVQTVASPVGMPADAAK